MRERWVLLKLESGKGKTDKKEMRKSKMSQLYREQRSWIRHFPSRRVMMFFRGGFGEYEMYAIGILSVKIFLLISVMPTF